MTHCDFLVTPCVQNPDALHVIGRFEQHLGQAASLLSFVISHLLQSIFVEGLDDSFCILPRPFPSDLPERQTIYPARYLPLAFGKAVKNHSTMPATVGKQHSISTGPPCPGARHSLLDNAAAQIRIDQSLLGLYHRLVQPAIGDLLAALKIASTIWS
jgi:hypothetical protein